MEIGGFRVKLNVKEGWRLGGYPNTKNRFCKGVVGDIEVNGILFKDTGKYGCLISADILGIEKSFVERLREEVEKRFNIPTKNLIFSCTHTHSSVSSVGNFVEEDFLTELKLKILYGIEKAIVDMAEVKIKVGKGEVDISHNRRVEKNGKVVNEWVDFQGIHKGLVDNEIGIVLFLKKGIFAKSIIVNYSCHPVVMGPDNYYASADFVGYARELLIKELPVNNVVYLSGACGDINPKVCLTSDFRIAEKTGTTLGKRIVESLTNLVEVPLTYFDITRKEVFFRKKEGEGEIQTEIQILKLGDEIIFITFPGELIVEIGQWIKKNSKFPFTFIAGYSNDYIGYISSNEVLEKGGHEANSCKVRDVKDTLQKELKEILKE